MSSEMRTAELQGLLHRFREGDAAALEELLRRTGRRLEQLARVMLHRFPRVRQHEQTGDVMQEAMLSLLSALRQLPFSSTREFYGLAAEHIRRRLIDLTRRHARAHLALDDAIGSPEQLAAPQDEEMDRWQALHEAVDTLPADQREVFSLRFYHGWSNQDAAELLQVSTRTVSRLWIRAVLALSQCLGDAVSPMLEREETGG